MATDSALLALLRAKTGVSNRRLNQRANKLRRELPMSIEMAYLVLAHQEGIDIRRFITGAQEAEVRNVVAQLRAMARPAPTRANGRARPAKAPAKQTVVTIADVNIENVPGLDSAHARDAKEMATTVYPMLYVFENSARDIVARVLGAAYGPDWFTKAVPKRIRERAEKTKADEEKDAWHGARGRRDIDYVLLSDLATIVRARWELFDEIFPRESWFEELVSGDMNVPRRVIAHMHPVPREDIKLIESAFRKWANQLKAKADKLP